MSRDFVIRGNRQEDLIKDLVFQLAMGQVQLSLVDLEHAMVVDGSVLSTARLLIGLPSDVHRPSPVLHQASFNPNSALHLLLIWNQRTLTFIPLAVGVLQCFD